MELAQILVQFSEEQCVLVEKGSHGVVYRITVYPTNPEWVSQCSYLKNLDTSLFVCVCVDR